MKKFKLTITISDFIIYQAIYTFNENQYQNMLDGYKDSFNRGLYQIPVLEELTSEVFDKNKDYVKEAPDAVVASMICERVDLFNGDGWRHDDCYPLESDEASVNVNIDTRELMDWKCEVINE